MKKTFKIIGIFFAVVLVLFLFLVLSPFIFREKFSEIVKNTANKSLKTEMNYSKLDISFLRHFPNLTISLEDFSLKSSAPFSRDTLISAREISFGINLASIFHGPVRIDKVYLNRGRIVLKYNEKGASNFDVVRSSSDTVKTAQTTPAGIANIKIEHIIVSKTNLIYSDPYIPMEIKVQGLNYSGKCDITQDILHLKSRVRIDSISVRYDQYQIVRSKPVKANLTTSINLNSFDMKFEKNDLHIKDIPFEFRGEFNFRKGGYAFSLSLYSTMGDEYLGGYLWLISEKNLWIYVKAGAKANLENWAKGFGIRDVDLKGLFTLKVDAEGEYITGQNPESRKPDTIPLSIPKFSVSSDLKNGYLHFRKVPQAISNISFNLTASCSNNDYRTVNLQLENLKARFLKNQIDGYIRVNGMDQLPVDARVTTHLDLSELKQVVPLDSMDVKGILDLDLSVKGNYAPEKKLFPLAKVNIGLQNGSVLTKYYPHPVEDIQASAILINQTGKLADTKINLDPLSFRFEGNPFEIHANLSNPENLDYAVTANGSIDVASIYKVFSREGMDLKGFIAADLNLKGRQSDAMAGRYEKLHNTGKLVLRDIAFTSEFLPKPFVVKSGIFRFENDKIWFDKFVSRYGNSDLTMNGHLFNVLNYLLVPKQKLKGSFDLHSGYLVVDEFLAPETTTSTAPKSASSSEAKNASQAPEGVIVIPDDLEIGLKADVGRISFQKLNIKDLDAAVEVRDGILHLKSMSFDVIGCKVNMDATYGSITPVSAYFDFHVKAEDFDIKKAYDEIELFRNLTTAAGKCEGTVSLDYSLKGKLKSGMEPIYPSLDGGGTLSLKKVKVMGLKLFTQMSKNLDREKINNPDLSKVEIKTTIKNNVISVEKTKLKFAGFRFKVSGETNFNGSLNLKARLGLPPLGIFGIPIRILGTQDKPKFKYGRGNNDESVEETQYSDTIPADVLQKIKNVKEEDLKDETPEK
ncbi:MAG: AsmA-like C-terminal region-containing protein [Bacteroidota bacterium]|nr:AsmA-like C-terminal region-containing protein [Bacteroidota bacterium]